MLCPVPNDLRIACKHSYYSHCFVVVFNAVLAICFQIVFEKIFSANPIKPLFIMRDNTIHEWQFRWTLDRYVSSVDNSGRILAFSCHECQSWIFSYGSIGTATNHSVA